MSTLCRPACNWLWLVILSIALAVPALAVPALADSALADEPAAGQPSANQNRGVSKRPRRYSLEEIARERPEGTVTVQFVVTSAGHSLAPRRVSEQPYDPLYLAAPVGDSPHDRFEVFINGPALTHLHAVGIGDLEKHFTGRGIEVTGKVGYAERPHIQADGTEDPSRPRWKQYGIFVTSLDQLYVVPLRP
jgi:hypothetical protein